MKTTTLALLTVFTFGRIRRRRRVNLFKKSVPEETVTRSISLVLVSIGINSIVLFLLLTADPVTGWEAHGPPAAFIGKSLNDLNLRAKHHVHVIAVKELVPENYVLAPPADFVIKDSDILIILGKSEDIRRIHALK